MYTITVFILLFCIIFVIFDMNIVHYVRVA